MPVPNPRPGFPTPVNYSNNINKTNLSLKSLNKTDHDIWCWKSRSWVWDRHKNMARLNQLMGF
jgi:hypothetical protein